MKHVAALVLAAGQSRRMGAANKLLVEIEGVPMVARVAAAALESKAETVLVVTGHQAEAVGDALAGHIEAAVNCLGDMPWIGAAVIDSLIDGFHGQGICLPTHRGRRGNPVLWARRYFTEMQSIEGDQEARGLIGLHEDVVHEVPWDDDSVLRDVDQPRDASARSGT